MDKFLAVILSLFFAFTCYAQSGADGLGDLNKKNIETASKNKKEVSKTKSIPTQSKKNPPQKKPSSAVKKAQPIKPIVDKNLPTVTQIDQAGLTAVIKRDVSANSKPLLVNFWATWCEPCVEEFPDLVKIDEEFRGKLDFITISLDDLSELKTGVPKFLASMKATMPAYLLKATNEEAAISSVSKDWQGGLPFTILFDGKGGIVYSRQGIVKPEILRSELNKVLTTEPVNTAAQR